MRPVFTGAEMRRVDERAIRDLHIPGAVLMENAGRAAADVAAAWLRDAGRPWRSARVVVLCGKGGNGGDGFVVARHLRRLGVRCDVVLVAAAGEVGGDAAGMLRALRAAGGRPFEMQDAAALSVVLSRADLVVDALLGTGFRGAPTERTATAIDAVNGSGRPVLALDLPSGLAADGGPPAGRVVRATATVTFAGLKRGLVMPPGRELAGRVTVVGIGVPDAEVERGVTTYLLEAADVARHFPPRDRVAHKGSYGHLLVVAGSLGKTGAAALAANAAMRSGAGLVTVATAATQQPTVAGLVVEAMTAALAEGAAGSIGPDAWSALMELAAARDAIAVGPGLGIDAQTRALVRRLVQEARVPIVADADALTALADDLTALTGAAAARCLTPHPGEMARLLGVSVADVQRDRIAVTRDFATAHGTCVVLKGAVSVVAAPDGTVLLNPTGNPGMASGGTGDVLTGMVGAFLARGLPAIDALASAVFLHGLAGDVAAEAVGEESLVARDVIAALPSAFARLRPDAAAPEVPPARHRRARPAR